MPAFSGRCESRRYGVARPPRPFSPLLSSNPQPACSLQVAWSLSNEDWETPGLRRWGRASPFSRPEDAQPAADTLAQELGCLRLGRAETAFDISPPYPDKLVREIQIAPLEGQDFRDA